MNISAGDQQPANSDLTKTYAPVPDVAKSPDPLPGKSYYIGKAAKDIYWVNKNGYSSMVIVTNCSVVVVDAPTFIGQDLMVAIKEISNLPVSHLIYSHSHIDHIGDASPMFDKAIKVGHVETAKVLRKRRDPKRPVPTSTFIGDTMTLKIGKYSSSYGTLIHWIRTAPTVFSRQAADKCLCKVLLCFLLKSENHCRR